MKHLKHYRRKFILLGTTGILTSLFAALPKNLFGQQLFSNDPKGIVVNPNEGEHILTGRRKVPITLKISKDKHGIENISFCTEDMLTGRKMRVHKHLYHDEIIFIHRGEGRFTLDDQTFDVQTGSVAYVPRGTWHGLENTGNGNLFMTFGYTPSGFEGYFRENGIQEGMPARKRSEEEYAATEKKYGMVYK